MKHTLLLCLLTAYSHMGYSSFSNNFVQYNNDIGKCLPVIKDAHRQSSDTATVPGIGNINQGNEDVQFTVFPNPANGVVTFTYHVPTADNGINIKVTNMVGTQVADITAANSQGSVYWDTRTAPPGLYIYLATGEKGAITIGKLVIVK